MPALALYQPDIPQNLGSFIRLAACLNMPLHIIEPCGFPLDDRKIRRAAMDYGAEAKIIRHVSWDHFLRVIRSSSQRIIVLTTKATIPYTEVAYQSDDILLLGRESSGVPPEVHEAADLRVTIPMRGQCRSLNVVNAAAMVAGEVIRQVAF
jgi:tRNA (cytidine/uridine-2'-O-)-methyltransferase